MATLTRTSQSVGPRLTVGIDIGEYMKASNAAWQKLQAASDAVDLSKTLVGGLITFPVADGKAAYVVAKDKPLTLQPLDFGDSYRADPILIRGLRAADVRTRIEQNRRINALFHRQTG